MSSMGSLELLKETPLNDKQTDTIISSNSVLLMLIEDILDLVKIEYESKKKTSKEILNQVFPLDDCLKSLKDIVSGYAAQFGVILEFHIDAAAQGIFVESNRSRLHQILSNLLTNAVKASKKNGVVEVFCNIKERNSSDIATFCFQVKDYGTGIPKSKLSYIFEPFVQLNSLNESKVPR